MFWYKNEKSYELSFQFKKKDDFFFRENGKLWIRFDKLVDLAEKVRKELVGFYDKKVKLSKFDSFINNCGISLQEGEVESLFDYINDHIAKVLFDRYYLGKILQIQWEENRSLDELLEIFIRFNSGGLKLEKSDLIFSVLKAYWRDVEQEMYGLADKTGISRDLLLKALIIVSDISARTSVYDAAKKISDLKQNFTRFKEIIEEFHDKLSQITQLPDRIYRKFNFLIPVIYSFGKMRKI